jgi:hypothetical protein
LLDLLTVNVGGGPGGNRRGGNGKGGVGHGVTYYTPKVGKASEEWIQHKAINKAFALSHADGVTALYVVEHSPVGTITNMMHFYDEFIELMAMRFTTGACSSQEEYEWGAVAKQIINKLEAP